jgi:diadenosine tetraphosphatase ApaH/serine/threonine PP2A family protein phosphatase
MRILLLSDIHGNKHGLQAALDAAGRVDRIVCLGDVVGYGAFPNECCEILRDAGALCLSGNHDAAALELISIEWFNNVATAAILWTRKQLTPENREWLASLPAERSFPEERFQAVHASLRSPWEEYILNEQIAQMSFERMEQPLCFYGHTHVADLYWVKEEDLKKTPRPVIEHAMFPGGGGLEMEEGELYLLNPGSCGQPRDGNPDARFALFETEERIVDVFCVEYDVKGARAAIIEAGLPAMLGDRLLSGQ